KPIVMAEETSHAQNEQITAPSESPGNEFAESRLPSRLHDQICAVDQFVHRHDWRTTAENGREALCPADILIADGYEFNVDAAAINRVCDRLADRTHTKDSDFQFCGHRD